MGVARARKPLGEPTLPPNCHTGALVAPDGSVDGVDASLAELAEFVTGGLADAGIPRCKGDAMATHPSMRRSLEGWIEALETWRHDLSPSGSIFSSIVYDFRRVTGPLDPEPEFETAIREAGRYPAFVRHLAHCALADRPPTGFLRDLVLERKESTPVAST